MGYDGIWNFLHIPTLVTIFWNDHILFTPGWLYLVWMWQDATMICVLVVPADWICDMWGLAAQPVAHRHRFCNIVTPELQENWKYGIDNIYAAIFYRFGGTIHFCILCRPDVHCFMSQTHQQLVGCVRNLVVLRATKETKPRSVDLFRLGKPWQPQIFSCL